MIFTGQVRDLGGAPLAAAEVDTWHADADGYYSGFAPHVPEGNLRGVVVTGQDGRSRSTPSSPRPIKSPHDGPTGKMIQAAGWHPGGLPPAPDDSR